MTGSGALNCYALYGAGNGKLINLAGGLVDIQSDVSITSSSFGVYGEAVVNQGTVRKSGGTGTSTIDSIFNNTGTVDVQSGTVNLAGGGSLGGGGSVAAGAQLNFTGGSFSGESFSATGPGLASFAGGSANLSGNVSLVNLRVTGGTVTINGTIASLILAGGTLAGTNGILSGLMTWTSGTMGSGSILTIATNGVLVLAGSAQKTLYGTITNAGTIQITGSGALYCYGGYEAGKLINLAGGLVDIQSDVSITRSGSYSSEAIVNQGTILKSGGTGTTTIAPIFNNTGTLDVQTGTVSITGGGSNSGLFNAQAGTTLALAADYTLSSGGQFSGAGTNLWSSGTITLNGSVTSSNAILAGATLAGTNGILSGLMTWTSGAMGSGSSIFTIATNGVLVLAGSGTKSLNGTI